jgi:hypothetical protein
MVEGLERVRFPIVPQKWPFSIGRVAFYFRNTGFFKTERWLFSRGLCSVTGETEILGLYEYLRRQQERGYMQ